MFDVDYCLICLFVVVWCCPMPLLNVVVGADVVGVKCSWLFVVCCMLCVIRVVVVCCCRV